MVRLTMAVPPQALSSEIMDAKIPQLAAVAVRRAYDRAMAIGGRVVVAEHGRLMEVRADGAKTELHPLPAAVHVKVGSVLSRKHPR